jgi:hypothetical protein
VGKVGTEFVHWVALEAVMLQVVAFEWGLEVAEGLEMAVQLVRGINQVMSLLETAGLDLKG